MKVHSDLVSVKRPYLGLCRSENIWSVECLFKCMDTEALIMINRSYGIIRKIYCLFYVVFRSSSRKSIKDRYHIMFIISFNFSGLTIGVTVIEGTFDKMYGESQAARLSLRQGIQEEGVKGFPDVVVSTNVSDGICHL